MTARDLYSINKVYSRRWSRICILCL